MLLIGCCSALDLYLRHVMSSCTQNKPKYPSDKTPQFASVTNETNWVNNYRWICAGCSIVWTQRTKAPFPFHERTPAKPSAHMRPFNNAQQLHVICCGSSLNWRPRLFGNKNTERACEWFRHEKHWNSLKWSNISCVWRGGEKPFNMNASKINQDKLGFYSLIILIQSCRDISIN